MELNLTILSTKANGSAFTAQNSRTTGNQSAPAKPARAQIPEPQGTKSANVKVAARQVSNSGDLAASLYGRAPVLTHVPSRTHHVVFCAPKTIVTRTEITTANDYPANDSSRANCGSETQTINEISTFQNTATNDTPDSPMNAANDSLHPLTAAANDRTAFHSATEANHNALSNSNKPEESCLANSNAGLQLDSVPPAYQGSSFTGKKAREFLPVSPCRIAPQGSPQRSPLRHVTEAAVAPAQELNMRRLTKVSKFTSF